MTHQKSPLYTFPLYFLARSDKQILADRAKLLGEMEQMKDETEALRLEAHRLRKGKDLLDC